MRSCGCVVYIPSEIQYILPLWQQTSNNNKYDDSRTTSRHPSITPNPILVPSYGNLPTMPTANFILGFLCFRLKILLRL